MSAREQSSPPSWFVGDDCRWSILGMTPVIVMMMMLIMTMMMIWKPSLLLPSLSIRRRQMLNIPTQRQRPRQQRRHYLSILVLLFVVVCTHTGNADAGENMLENPGFETPYYGITVNAYCSNIHGQVAYGWEDNTCWYGANASIVYAPDTAVVYNGSTSQRIQFDGGFWQFAQFLHEPFISSSGSSSSPPYYTASIWLRANKSMQVLMQLRQADSPYTVYVSKSITITSNNGWQSYTISGVTAAGINGTLLLSGSDPGTLWVDDATLIRDSDEQLPIPLPTKSVPRAFFGVHYHLVNTPWPDVQDRIGTIRFWDCDSCQWAEIHTASGVFYWDVLDARVSAAVQHNADIVMNLGRTPQWASSRPDEYSPYGPGQAAEPVDPQYWIDWVTAVGNRYQGRIRYWEVWNEPNDDSFFSGSIETLVDLALQARDILLAIDPANQIVSPSPYDAGWLDDYLTAGGGESADVIGFHFYLAEYPAPPERLYDINIPNVLDVLTVHGQDKKPLWDTEAGWLALSNDDSTRLLPDEVAVGYVGRRMVLEWARGIGRMLFYSWDNHGYMSVEATLPEDSKTLTPAGLAYREMAGWLTGSILSDMTVDESGTWVATLLRKSGITTIHAYVVWNPDYSSAAPLNWAVPTTWDVTEQLDLAGQSYPLVVVDAQGILGVEQRPWLLQNGGSGCRKVWPQIRMANRICNFLHPQHL